MADNYTLFSELIGDLNEEELKWLAEEYEKLADTDYGESFRMQLDGDEAWLYSEEGIDMDQLVDFVQRFIKNYRPDYVFTATFALTCSKPRVGEFGGSWVSVTKDEVKYGNTWDAARKAHAK